MCSQIRDKMSRGFMIGNGMCASLSPTRSRGPSPGRQNNPPAHREGTCARQLHYDFILDAAMRGAPDADRIRMG